MVQKITTEAALQITGAGLFQKRLFVIFGLVWAADAMQVLSIGFTAASIAASFSVTVPQALQTGTLFFLGMLLGAFVFGRLADRIGRKPVLMMSIIIDSIFGIASAFAPDLMWLCVARFLTGIGVGGTLPVDYAMMAEFLPAQKRGRWLVLLESFWAFGTVIIAILALVASNIGGEAWRTIFFVTGIPALIGVGLRFYVPESPLYLNRNNQSEKARHILQHIAETNGIKTTIPELQSQPKEKKSLAALFGPGLARRTIFLLGAWFLISLSYYGVFVYLPVKLAGQGFGYLRGQWFLVLIALAQLPGFALSAYGVERFGRKPTLVSFLLLSAIFALLYSAGTSTAVVVGATLMISFALLGAWGAIYAYTPEVYPTALRASGMGLAGAIARCGGLLAPSIVAPVMATSFTTALAVIAALLVISALCIWFIDAETKDVALA